MSVEAVVWLIAPTADQLWMGDWLINPHLLTNILTRWLIDDWLIHWLIGWLNDWFSDWLTGWLIGWLVGWLIDWLTDWLIEWLMDWLTDRLIDLLIDWSIDRSIVWLINWHMYPFMAVNMMVILMSSFLEMKLSIHCDVRMVKLAQRCWSNYLRAPLHRNRFYQKSTWEKL